MTICMGEGGVEKNGMIPQENKSVYEHCPNNNNNSIIDFSAAYSFSITLECQTLINCQFIQGLRSRGAGGARAPPPQYFQNYKELVGKSVLCPPILEQ